MIAGYSERLVSRLPERTQRESAAAIGAAADRGTALVRQLLSFSRPQPSDRRLIDLNTLVGEFVPMLRRVIGEDIELELAFERHPLPVEVDPARIDQVLMNLVVNARDAMPYGGRLTIATAAVDVDEAAGDRLVRRRTAVVTVSDTGAGMDAATRERIFEPFFTTKEPGKGSGLGLATASGIVARQTARSRCRPHPGAARRSGSTFRSPHPRLAGRQPSRSPSRRPRWAGPRRVLLVEDEACPAGARADDARGRRLPGLAAANAAEALELAGRHAFDLLVADVVMPGMSGPQLVDELRARGCDLPTIFVSGYGSDEFSSRGVHAARRPRSSRSRSMRTSCSGRCARCSTAPRRRSRTRRSNAAGGPAERRASLIHAGPLPFVQRPLREARRPRHRRPELLPAVRVRRLGNGRIAPDRDYAAPHVPQCAEPTRRGLSHRAHGAITSRPQPSQRAFPCTGKPQNGHCDRRTRRCGSRRAR